MGEWKFPKQHIATLVAKMDYGELVEVKSIVKAKSKKDFENMAKKMSNEIKKGKYVVFFEGPQINCSRIAYYQIFLDW